MLALQKKLAEAGEDGSHHFMRAFLNYQLIVVQRDTTDSLPSGHKEGEKYMTDSNGYKVDTLIDIWKQIENRRCYILPSPGQNFELQSGCCKNMDRKFEKTIQELITYVCNEDDILFKKVCDAPFNQVQEVQETFKVLIDHLNKIFLPSPLEIGCLQESRENKRQNKDTEEPMDTTDSSEVPCGVINEKETDGDVEMKDLTSNTIPVPNNQIVPIPTVSNSSNQNSYDPPNLTNSLRPLTKSKVAPSLINLRSESSSSYMSNMHTSAHSNGEGPVKASNESMNSSTNVSSLPSLENGCGPVQSTTSCVNSVGEDRNRANVHETVENSLATELIVQNDRLGCKNSTVVDAEMDMTCNDTGRSAYSHGYDTRSTTREQNYIDNKKKSSFKGDTKGFGRGRCQPMTDNDDNRNDSLSSGTSNFNEQADEEKAGEKKKIEEEKQELERKQKTIDQAVEVAFDFLKKNEPNVEQLLELNEESLLNWYGRIELSCMAKLEESYKYGWEGFLREAKVGLHNKFQTRFDEAKKMQAEKRVELVNKVTVHKIGLIVCDEVKKTFAAKAEQFTKENKPNWAEILFQEHLDRLIKEKCGYQSAHLQNEVKGFVIMEFNKKNLYTIFQCLEKASKKYIQDMEKTFHCYICMTPEKFQTEHEKALQNAVALLFEKKAEDLLRNFLSHHEELFFRRNNKIKEEEKEVVKFSHDQTVLQYNKIMTQLADTKMMDFTELKKQHDHLVNKLTEIFFKAINIVDDHALKKSELKNELAHKLAAEYGRYKIKIQAIIEKASQEINKTVHTFRLTYNENMQKAPKEEKEFENLHTSVLHEQTILLRKILREKYPSEDQERQAKKLKLHCEEDFKTLKVENEKKWIALKKKEAADTIAAKEKEAEEGKKRREAMEKKRQEVLVNKNEAVAKNRASTAGSSYAQNLNSSSQKSRPKAILAIHFGLEFIRCGVNDGANYKCIPNEWGDLKTPNVIALTQSEVLIGNQVTGKFRAQNEGHVWDMSEVLSEHVFIPKEHNKKMALMGEVVTITRELLVSLILHRMKIVAENHCQMEFNRVVMTIPLWFTIVQKQSMKDAARIAGFEESFFISESTAAALYVANHEYRIKTSNNLLTVVVDPLHVEAAVYNYRNGTVEMIASQGNLHCDGPESIWFGKKIWKSVTNFVVGGEDPSIKLIRKVAKGNHCNEFIFISTSNMDCKYLDAAAELAKPASNVDPVFTILLGAMLYARKLMDSRTSKMPLKLFKDKSPYALKFVRSSKEGSIFGQGRSFVGKPFKQDREFEEDGVLSLQIKEDGGPYSFDTGILKVSTKNNSSGLTKGKYKIRFTLSFEGEFTIAAQEEIDTGVNKKSVQLTKTEHVFVPNGNLTETEMTELQNFMAVYHYMTSTANENPNAPLEEAKNNLQEYISEMETNLDKIQRPIVQNVIKNDIQAAKEMLQHEGTTIELLEKKLATLTNMKSKYF